MRREDDSEQRLGVIVSNERVDYQSEDVPDDYQCTGCGEEGVKLWRPYQSFSPELLCVNCAAAEEHEDISDIDESGTHTDREMAHRTDQIGGYVPAVPDEEGVGFWGYTSVPEAGVNWWRRLPTRR